MGGRQCGRGGVEGAAGVVHVGGSDRPVVAGELLIAGQCHPRELQLGAALVRLGLCLNHAGPGLGGLGLGLTDGRGGLSLPRLGLRQGGAGFLCGNLELERIEPYEGIASFHGLVVAHEHFLDLAVNLRADLMDAANDVSIVGFLVMVGVDREVNDPAGHTETHGREQERAKQLARSSGLGRRVGRCVGRGGRRDRRKLRRFG